MIVVQTPLRISFVGGGTDFKDFYRREEGAVLSSAIDKHVYVIVKERFDEKIYVNYSKKEVVDRVDELEHELVREAMRLTGVDRGVEITTLADVPSEGSGLGSSSSVTVGLLQALSTYQGQILPTEELARFACRIEIDILGKPIGKQDQYIAAYGGLQRLRFCSDESVHVEALPLSEETKRRLGENLLLFFTNRTRSSADILTEQRDGIPAQRAALHEMAGLVKGAWDSLVEGDLDGLGELLDRGWRLKKSLASRISDGEIDNLYERACKAGAVGGKIAGAGGGGFLLLYVPKGRQDDVRQALGHLRELPFNLERDGSKVIFNIRR